MKLNLRSLVLSGDYDAIPVAVAGFFLIQALCAYGGIGVSPDSVVYISTAGNIHDHHLMNDFTDMPVMDFPTFYPIFLSALLFLTGHSVLSFGPALNGSLFATLILLSGWIMKRFSRASRGYTLLLLLFILGSPCLLEVYSYIWSETLYLLLSLLFLIAGYGYFRTHRPGWLLFMAGTAGLACVTRYAGISLIGLGGLLMLCDAGLRRSWKKIGHLALFGTLSILPMALNLYRNHVLTGTLTGYREPGIRPFRVNLHYFGAVLCDWLPFFNGRYGAATVIAVFFILLITGIFIYRLVRKAGFFSYDTLAIGYFVVYTGFILTTATVSRFQPLDSRLLSPLFLPWLWGSTVWIPRALDRCPVRSRNGAILLCLIAAACFLEGEWQTFKENWDGIHDAGIPGYTEDTWRKSPTMAFVREHRDSLQRMGTIYSDAFEGLWFLGGGLKAELLPHKDNVEDIRYMLKEDHFTVIWFDDALNVDLIGIPFIRSHKELVREQHFEDGAIYFFRTALPAPAIDQSRSGGK